MAKQILQVRPIRARLSTMVAGIAAALILAAAVPGYAKADARLSTQQLESKSLERTVPYNVILPRGYADASNAGKKYPVLYLLHGLTGHYARKSRRNIARVGLSSINTPAGWSFTSRISHSSRKIERNPLRRSTPTFWL